MTKPKLILSDIDGTLLTDEAKILPATVMSVKRAVNAGATMVLASARSPKGMFGLAQQLGLNSTMIAYNGALTAKMTATKLTVLEERPIEPQLAAKVQRLVAQNWPEASINIYTGNQWLVSEMGSWETQEATGIGYQPEVVNQAAWLQRPTAVSHKVMIMAAPAVIQAIEQALQAPVFAGISAYRSKPTYLEIVAAGVSKAAALQTLIADEKLSPAQAIAFGDNFNDLALLKLVGVGVAMGNAPAAVKTAATVVTTDNNHNGIQQVLDQYFA
ncbi:Cof-type HAD-IIB family hydrolase [Lactiplantibacillus sp. WILCCON 0030]|uniref:Cof-type HAD-IIB family hydrolase n=1 Tax=Lactiplantibacillus brownii TaxID=3069269 RepID=A0ABU1ACS5_9LACO|nr:Cof-type HAD-IIB family hydrolase [Lactiplantibacillus brownii]MDQ7938445.1 Cof-type HAD-IIB family hydrolase [Lactiplantibacillus brownii]